MILCTEWMLWVRCFLFMYESWSNEDMLWLWSHWWSRGEALWLFMSHRTGMCMISSSCNPSTTAFPPWGSVIHRLTASFHLEAGVSATPMSLFCLGWIKPKPRISLDYCGPKQALCKVLRVDLFLVVLRLLQLLEVGNCKVLMGWPGVEV